MFVEWLMKIGNFMSKIIISNIEKTKYFPLQEHFFEKNQIENYKILIDNIINVKVDNLLCYK
jgi:hypothetical protein